MELEIALKLKVNIKDLETNINGIARAVKEVMKDIGKEIFKKVLTIYQSSIKRISFKWKFSISETTP